MVTRDRVTLRGTDPTTDGIRAEVNVEQVDAALWVRGAHLVNVENLKLTNGFVGLLATDVNTPNLNLINCRLEGNVAYGAVLENSLLQGQTSVFADNGSINAGVFVGSRFGCFQCQLSNPLGTGPIGPRENILALSGSRIVMSQTTLTGGGINADQSLIVASDSTIEGLAPNGPSISSVSKNAINLTRVQLAGAMRFLQGSHAILLGVTQTTSAFPNIVDDDSYLRLGDAPPALGGPPSIPSNILSLNVRNFARASLQQTSTITGNLNCNLGGETICTTPTNVSGTSSCGLCVKP